MKRITQKAAVPFGACTASPSRALQIIVGSFGSNEKHSDYRLIGTKLRRRILESLLSARQV